MQTVSQHPSPAAPVAVNGLNFDSEVLGAAEPVLVDVSAAWCGPCRAAEPVVAQMARELAGRAKVVKLDADEAPEITQQLGIRGVPTFVLFAGGREVARQVGYPGPKALWALVEPHLEKASGV